MKYLKLLIILISLPFCTGCNNDDDKGPGPDPQNTELEGKWNLVNISGGFAGFNYDFEKGLITWTFDESEKKIVVVNNNPADVYDALGMGTYDYEYVLTDSQSCNSTLNITQGDSEVLYNFGCHEIDGTTLTFSQIEVDGFKLTLVR